MKLKNEDIPQATILRNLMDENRRLRQELGELTCKLNNKEVAIRAFKKWQSGVATYKYNYWLNEGLRLMEEMPNMEQVKALRTILGRNTLYKTWFDRCNEVARKMEQAKVALSKSMEGTSDEQQG